MVAIESTPDMAAKVYATMRPRMSSCTSLANLRFLAARMRLSNILALSLSWRSYLFPKPGTTAPTFPKVSFVTRVGDLGCGVGYYK
jgi:hypothetical protein